MIVIRYIGQIFPVVLTPVMQDFNNCVGPHLPFVQRLACANRWLLSTLILKTYLSPVGGAAAVHTTIVPTIFQSGMRDNVVPTSARATINLRRLPGLSVAVAIRQVQTWLPNAGVKAVRVGRVAEAPRGAAATGSLGYRSIERKLRRQLPGVVTTPFLFVAQLDSRHFTVSTPNVYNKIECLLTRLLADASILRIGFDECLKAGLIVRIT